MHVLIAPLEYKGTLSARDAAAAIAEGLGRAHPEWTLERLPLADGGPGTLEALLAAKPSMREVHVLVEDALGRRVKARFGVDDPGCIAFVELAEAAGLHRLSPEERAPLLASTFGVGQLLCAALDQGCGHVVLGLGGSATGDAGAGALQAMGVKLLDENGRALPRGAVGLLSLTRVDASARDSRLLRLELATDVTSPLLGAAGASRLFGPQKGASQEEVEHLERALTHFAALTPQLSPETEGAGAAGGTAFGLAAWLGGSICSGFELLAEALNLEAAIARADLVITGEGHFDRQSLLGKGPARLAHRARALQKKVALLAGRIDGVPGLDALFDVHLAAPGPESPQKARKALVEAAAALSVF